MRVCFKNVVLGLFAFWVGPGAHAACDRLPIEGLTEHTDYRGDLCTLEVQIYDQWVNHRAQVFELNQINTKMAATPDPKPRTDLFMEINRLTIRLRGELTNELRGLFGLGGQLTLTLQADPHYAGAGPLQGYSIYYERDWVEGTWPITDHAGSITIRLALLEDSPRNRVEICVGSECREFDDKGQPGELRVNNPR